MDKEAYLGKSKKDMESDMAKKIAEARKKKVSFKYKIDKKKLKKQIKEMGLGSALAELINFKGSQLKIKQANKDNKGK